MDTRVDFITLATGDLDAARRFYVDGLGWTPTLDVPGEIIFFQIGYGLMLGLFDAQAFAADLGGGGGAAEGVGATDSAAAGGGAAEGVGATTARRPAVRRPAVQRRSVRPLLHPGSAGSPSPTTSTAPSRCGRSSPTPKPRVRPS